MTVMQIMYGNPVMTEKGFQNSSISVIGQPENI